MKKILLLILAGLPIFSAAQTIPSYVPTNGLIGWWPFNGNANDESGNGNNGTVNGATLTTDKLNNPNSAYLFNSNEISINNSNNFNVSQFTVSAWIKTASTSPMYETGFSYSASDINNNEFGYWLGKYNQRACLYVSSGVSGGVSLTGTTLINDNAWHLLIGTYDGISAKIYLDGILENSINCSLTNLAITPKIGNDFWNEYFAGTLDEIGVWNRVLTQQEIAGLTQSNSSSCINLLPVGSSTNAYTNINKYTAPITVNKDLNTVIFAHRNNTGAFGGSSGHIRYDISQDGGNTWTNDIGPTNPQLTWAGRYPQASIHNPIGNTNPQNAYLAYMGATFDGTYWNGTVTGTRQLNGSTNTENYNQPAVTGNLIPYSLTEGAPGVFWATELVSDGMNNSTGQHRLYKGVWNGTDVVWAENAVFTPNYDFGGIYVYGLASIAFAPGGQTGWVCFLADLDKSNTTDPQHYPVLYKTINGGSSWSGPIEIPLINFPGSSCLSTTFSNPIVSEYSLTVDANGNPHILSSIVSATNGNYGLYDITSNGISWFANHISAVNTILSNPLSDNSNWHLWPEMTRSTDGTKIFYTWLDNQNVTPGSPNDAPDLLGKGYDVVNNNYTSTINFTACNPSCAGKIFFPQVADRVLEPSANSYKIACVYSNLTNMDPLQTTSLVFLDSLKFTNADFNIPYLPPTLVTNATGTVSGTSICLGDSIYVSGSASNASTITWHDQAGNTFNNNSWISPSATATLTMLASDNQGCPATGGVFNINVGDPSFLIPFHDSIIPSSCSISNNGSVHLISRIDTVTGTEPFISEYYIGSGNNIALEIYNPTGSPFDLGYFSCSPPYICNARLTSNAGAYNFPPNSIIPPYSSIVIANPNANPNILALANYTSSVIDGSAINLWVWNVVFNTGQVYDVSNIAAGQTTRRKLFVGAPNATLTTNEWSNYPLSTNGLGIHGQIGAYNVPGASIQWDVNAGGQTGPNAINLSPGTYTYTISYPSSICFYQGSVTVPSLGLDQFNVNFAATQVLFTTPPFVAQFNNNTPNPGLYNFIWDFGDGNVISSNNPSVFHQYLYNGLYTVTLIAEAIGTGCKDTLIKNGYIFCTGGSTCGVVANIQPPMSNSLCQGDTTFLSCITNPAYSYQWYNNGLAIPGETNPVLAVTQSGAYQVYVSNSTCTQISNQILLTFFAAPQVPQIVSSGNITACTGGTVTLLATTGYNSYNWSNGSTSNPTTVTSSGNYFVTAYNQQGCGSTSSPISVNIAAAPAPGICYATVDSSSTYTFLVWDRPVTTTIDSFRIYRETMTNVYSHIASVDYDSLTQYNDYLSNPNVTSYRYKLSAIDTCGNETFLSHYHSTIHLQLLGFGNMQWTLYTIENEANPVSYYVVFRDNNSTGNFQPISGNIPGSNSTYTDINWNSYPSASYRVEVVWNYNCVPSRFGIIPNSSNGSVSLSNIKSTSLITSTQSQPRITKWIVSPNPANDQLNVSFAEPVVKNLIMRDATGRIVRTYNINGSQAHLSLEGLSSGFYYLSLFGEDSAAKKIIKE